MEIGETAAATATRQPANAAAQGTNLASDFDTFLTLLTAQIRNQDPLNPAESTEYATQLATFSNVEQGVRTNTLLSDLVTRLEVQGLDRLASWIGMEARTTGLTAYDGGTVTLEAEIPAVANAAQLVVSDAQGAEVGRVPIDARAGAIELIPTGFDGAPLPPGLYGYHVEPSAAGGVLAPVPAARYVPVREALIEGGSTVLVLDGGARIGSDEVTGLRPADGSGV